MKQMKDENLVDFVELRLKSKEDFCFRYNTSNKSAGLLEILFFPQPGDWPTQLYTRHTLYETFQKFYHKNCSKTFTSTTDHSYHMTSSTAHSSHVPVNLNSSPPSILSHIMHCTTARFLFPTCTLAKHPKPWGIIMMLETVYGGWFHIRGSVKDKHKQSRRM